MKYPRLQRILHALLFYAVCLLVSSRALADEVVIKKLSDIKIETVELVSEEVVLNAIDATIGATITESMVARYIKEIYALNRFEFVAIESQGSTLVIKLIELPEIANVVIEGNKVISKDDLETALKSIGLWNRMPFRSSVLHQIKTELVRQYELQGRYGSTAVTEVEEPDDYRVVLNIKIVENDVIRVQKVNFLGNNAFSDRRLRGVIKTKGFNWQTAFTRRNNYSRFILENDVELLKLHYLNSGYIDFNVSEVQVDLSPDKDFLFVTLNLFEGEQYNIGNISISGDMPIPREEVEQLLYFESGKTYNQSQIDTQVNNLKRRFGREGYLFSDILIDTIPDAQNKIVDLSFTIDPGRKIYVRRSEFTGNTRTKDEVLRREMRQYEGAMAQSHLLDLSRERIERLSFFKSVDLEYVPVEGTDDQVDVMVNVEEKFLGSIRGGISFSTVYSFSVNGEFSQANILGTGKNFSLSADLGYLRRSLNVSLYDPYFTEYGVGVEYSAYYSFRDLKYFSLVSYVTNTGGIKNSYSIPIAERSFINIGLEYQHANVNAGKNSYAEITEFIKRQGKNFNDIIAEISFSYEGRNNLVMPTRGINYYFGFLFTAFANKVYHWALSSSYKQYIPLDKQERFILKVGLEASFMSTFNSNNFVPFYKHYYAGGIGSVRGYAVGSLGPKAGRFNDKGQYNLTDRAFGGNLMLLGSVELILPLFRNIDGLRTSLFFDAGQVYNTNCIVMNDTCRNTVNLKDLRYSIGIGLTWVTFLGPISLSYAYPINPGRYDRTEEFQFTIGHLF